METLLANAEMFTVKIVKLDEELRVLKLSGEEAISEPFEFKLDLVSENDRLDLHAAMGKAITMDWIGPDDRIDRHFHGIIKDFEQGVQHGRFTVYHATVVPLLDLLKYRKNSRIFQHLDIYEILLKVFKAHGIFGDFAKITLSRSYEKREYCVQYRETDFNFVSRLMEEEGIYYYFEHHQNYHTMVITDNAYSNKNIKDPSTLIFREKISLLAPEDAINQFRFRESIRSGAYVLNDYYFVNPKLILKTKDNANDFKHLEIYEHPGGYINSKAGERYARIRMEQEQALRRQGEGHSNCRRLNPAFRFTLKEHYNQQLNTTYLLTKVSHHGSQPQALEEHAGGEGSGYSNSFSCIPADTAFRKHSKAKKPTVKGPQTAMVVGPAGEEIYVDSYGRVKVHFHWDRDGKRDEGSSCWIRVSHSWAGKSYGAMFLPRVGQEVIVDFLEGNPDAPIITGRVYNGASLHPYALPANKTRSTFKSSTIKTDGDKSNELRFEDKPDQEEIYLHGQKDWNIVIENDKTQQVKHDESLHVGNDRTKNVEKNQTETIGENKTISVGKNHSESIGDNASIDVGKNLSLSVAKNNSESVGENSDLNVGKNLSLNVGKNNNCQIGENQTENIGKNYELTTGENQTIQVGKNLTIRSGKNTIIDAADSLTLKCGSASIILKKDGTIQISGKNISVKGSGNVVIKGSKISEN